jgi:ADP-ribosylglycohydrolase
VILDQNGKEPVYREDASGTAPRLFAGSREVALELSSRNWDVAFRSEGETGRPIVRLAKGGGVRNPQLLARAQGAMLGQLLGSGLGSLFSGSESLVAADASSTSSIEMAASKRRILAGQPGSSGELAIAVARSLIDFASDRQSLIRVYADWVASSPVEAERAIESAVRGEPLAEDLSAMALARVAPFAIWGHAADPPVLAETVRMDTALTHPAPAATDGATVLALVLQALIQGKDPSTAVGEAHAFARRTGLAREVLDAIVESSESPSLPGGARPTGTVRHATQAALFHVTRSHSFEEGLQAAVAMGSHSDALPAVVGAFMGARFGREGIPQRLRNLVLSARAMGGMATPPRPWTYWGTDVMAMAEALLSSR